MSPQGKEAGAMQRTCHSSAQWCDWRVGRPSDLKGERLSHAPHHTGGPWGIIPSKEIPGLISFRMDWLDLLAVHSKENQSWVFFGRTDAEAETPVLWPPHAKS